MTNNSEVCLCGTPAALYCPEHEMDGPELRGRAYVELAQLYLGLAKPAAWPCNLVFEGLFGASRCTVCGRQWEPMTPQGSERHCVRELGSRLARANLRIVELEAQLETAEEFSAADAGGYMAALEERDTKIAELEKQLLHLRAAFDGNY